MAAASSSSAAEIGGDHGPVAYEGKARPKGGSWRFTGYYGPLDLPIPEQGPFTLTCNVYFNKKWWRASVVDINSRGLAAHDTHHLWIVWHATGQETLQWPTTKCSNFAVTIPQRKCGGPKSAAAAAAAAAGADEEDEEDGEDEEDEESSVASTHITSQQRASWRLSSSASFRGTHASARKRTRSALGRAAKAKNKRLAKP